MAFVGDGLPNGGHTEHYQITYDNVLSPADGLNRALGLLAACEQDFALMKSWFGGIDLKFGYPLPVQVANASGGAQWSDPPDIAFIFGSPSPTITLKPGSGTPATELRYLLVSEVTEMFMATQDRGWYESTSLFSGADEGSKGEGLSRFLGVQFQIANGLGEVPPSGFGLTYLWLNSSRQDFVDNNPDDHNPDITTGCTTLFLYYLHDQLDYSIEDIVAAAAPTLGGVYQKLTGRTDGWNAFIALVNDHYPPGLVYNPPSDNIFPVADLSAFYPPNQITCGYSESTSIFITRSAKAEVNIHLVSDDPSVVSVPPIVTVPFGAMATAVPIGTTALPLPFSPKMVGVHATYAGKTLDITVEVVPPQVATVVLSPDTVVCGNSSTGTVTLNNPSLLGPVVVDLICGAPGFATVPAQVTIPQNQASATFVITTPLIQIPFVPAHAVIVATYAGSSASATLTVTPTVVEGIVHSLTLFPATVTGGQSSMGVVRLEAAVPTPTLVGLAAQEIGVGPEGGGVSSVASVPPSIIIGAGQTTGTFQITTKPLTAPTTKRIATILAAAVVVKYAGLTITR